MVPTAEVTIDGLKYRMILDLNAMCKFEQETEKSALRMNDLTASDIRVLFWAALLREHPDITQEQVGRMLHTGNISEVTDQLTDLFTESVPEPDEEADEGKASGPTG